MLGRKIIIPVVLCNRSITTTCCLRKGSQLNKQVHMLKKIMAGREKGKRRWAYNENLPKIESVSKLSNPKGQGKESNRRITVLNKLFMKNITDLMATDSFSKSIVGLGIQVSAVRVSPDFQSLNVFWLAPQTENEKEVEKVLKSIAGPIRHELSQLRLMGEVPRVYFVRDRHYSKAAELDVLLSKADFGDDFVPTDPTLFMKSQLELQMKLPDEVRSKIYEIEDEMLENEDETYEDELPEMRNDVLGLDHSLIMKKIATNIDKSKKAWETFETKSETILGNPTPTRDFTAAQQEVERMAKESGIRDEFVKFLERKQFSKNTPERKKYKNLTPQDEEDFDYEYRDPLPDGDFIEEDHEIKK